MTKEDFDTETKEETKDLVTAAICWYIKLRNGKIMGFTDHDEEIEIDGISYFAKSGTKTSAAINGSNNNSMEIQGVITHDLITESDIMRGLYDNSVVKVMLVDYVLKREHKVIFKGTIGGIKMKNNKFVAELVGLSNSLNMRVCKTYSRNCRATFCDDRCRLKIIFYTHGTFSISKVINNLSFESYDLGVRWSLMKKIQKRLFQYGYVEFQSGLNERMRNNILSIRGKVLELASPLFYKIEVGDQFDICSGCDKNFATCRDVFDNAVNFRGEPWIEDVETHVNA